VNEPTLFEKDGWKIRTVNKDGEPWFVARDVCAALEIGNVTDAMCRLEKDEFDSIEVIDNMGRTQTAFAVTESGLYSLVLGSRKPEAKEFKRWITHDVLPAIRKHGMYATPDTVEAMLADPDTMIATLTALKEERAAKLEAQRQLAIAAPKVESFDALMSSADGISIGEAAKALGTGQNRLFRFLRGQSILMSDNLPYQQHVNAGHFRVIEQTWRDSDGNVHPSAKTLVTPRGLEYIRKSLRKGAAQ
jgi:anti-repressor protein